jgi:Holliday junction resolvase-like predicted endonuclease
MKKSSGEVAEEYFFNSLNATKTLGGVHFDSVEKNWKSSIPLENGKTLDGEYDIVLINKDSMGIVEVKFKVSRKDVENLAKKQVESFKRIFPNSAKYKFYLGIGSMSFNKQAEDEAKKLGIAIFKLNGDAVEIYDKNLKNY